MRLSEVKERPYQFQWGHKTDSCRVCRTEEELVAAHKPYIQIRSEVNETTYKELAGMIDPNFLQQGIRASQLNGIQFQSFDPEDTMNFLINSSKYQDNHVQYLNSIQFVEWEETGSATDTSSREKALLLLWNGNIRLNCTCPSFLYWGYQYLLTVLDAAIHPETRKPVKRNPQERGIVCKHTNRILRVLPFYSGDISTEIKAQFGG